MSREVKFRAWDKDRNKMVKVVALVKSFWGNCEQGYIAACEIYEDETEFGAEIQNVFNYELMQYIGLKDKNGKEIYEGDIVFIGDDKVSFKVAYCENQASFNFVSLDKLALSLLNFDNNTIEVISNIYENSKLL